MTEVSSQIQAKAALPLTEGVKYFEDTVPGMNFSLWIHVVRNSSYCTDRSLQLHDFRIRSSYILDPETRLYSAPVQSNLQNHRVYSNYCTYPWAHLSCNACRDRQRQLNNNITQPIERKDKI
jgi:hypothetical protein